MFQPDGLLFTCFITSLPDIHQQTILVYQFVYSGPLLGSLPAGHLTKTLSLYLNPQKGSHRAAQPEA